MRCFAHFDLQMCFSPQRRTIFEHPNFKKWSRTLSFLTFLLPNVLCATAAYNFSTSEQTKNGPNMRCFVHFDFQMCFSPQRRAIFRHLNRQKCSEPVMFCTFWLSNVLFATAACNFWFLLGAPTSAPAALTGLLFDWPDTRIIEKTQHFATSLTFCADVSSFFWLSRYCIFCRLTWRLYCWAMHLLFNCPYCRKFLFKLPSNMFQNCPEESYPKTHINLRICRRSMFGVHPRKLTWNLKKDGFQKESPFPGVQFQVQY